MSKAIDVFKITGSKKIKLAKLATNVPQLYTDKEHYEISLKNQTKTIDKLQEMLYAENRQAVLVVLQAFDAAGKDGTIKAVFKGLNPAGVVVKSFKRPSDQELDHDFMWRTQVAAPERGSITVFNRSYYEEVLVTKVHPEIVKEYQMLPKKLSANLKSLFEKRFQDINNYETYLQNNGIHLVKIFLHVSKKVQGERQIERIQNAEKNWKFAAGDIAEREHWNAYQIAYEEMINSSATESRPWYVVPADDKKNMRLIVSNILLDKLESLKLSPPSVSAAQAKEIEKYIATIHEQNKK
jgi:PPK2 family polyphosphate:nucleotide phosphotransferase